MSHHEEKNQAAKAKARQNEIAGKGQNQQGKQPGNRPQDTKGNPRDINRENVNAQQFRPNESEQNYDR